MKPDVIVCLGKSLLPGGKPDAVLRSRLRQTIKLMRKYSETPVILAGGKYHALAKVKTSEAKAMFNYLKKRVPAQIDNCIVEDKSSSTIDQFCRIKTQYAMPQGWEHLHLVTDEAHMPRAKLIMESIFGPGYKISTSISPLDISGVWGQMIIDREKELLSLTIKTRTSLIKAGDHESWLTYEKRFEEEKKRLLTDKKISITDTPVVV